MSIAFACTTCGKRFTVDDRLAGHPARCDACGVTMTIPAARMTPPGVPLMGGDPPAPAMPTARPVPGAPPRVMPGMPPVGMGVARPVQGGMGMAPPLPGQGGPPRSFPMPGGPPKAFPHAGTPPVAAAIPEAVPPQPAMPSGGGADAIDWMNESNHSTPSARYAPKWKRRREQSSAGNVVFAIVLTLLVLGGVGAGLYYKYGRAGLTLSTAPIPAPTPALPMFQPVSAGGGATVMRGSVTLAGRGPGQRTTLWMYLPAGVNKPGEAAPKSLPCVLIAPAGTPLIHGIHLAEGDRPEHAPWAAAGFVVIAYDLDGAPDGGALGRPSEKALRTAIGEFLASGGGLANARAALQYGEALLPEIDPARVVAVGHSSAATLALQFAAAEPKRIRACVAFAPAVDIEKHVGAAALHDLDRAVPGIESYAQHSSPKVLRGPACPVFLFHAADDDVVPIAASVAYSRGRGNVKLSTVPTGGHHNAMISQGIPAAINWLKYPDGAPPPSSAEEPAADTPKN